MDHEMGRREAALGIKKHLSQSIESPTAFFGVRVKLSHDNLRRYVISLYASNQARERTRLWNNIASFDEAVVMGDFIMVEFLEDRWQGKGILPKVEN